MHSNIQTHTYQAMPTATACEDKNGDLETGAHSNSRTVIYHGSSPKKLYGYETIPLLCFIYKINMSK